MELESWGIKSGTSGLASKHYTIELKGLGQYIKKLIFTTSSILFYSIFITIMHYSKAVSTKVVKLVKNELKITRKSSL